MSKKGSAKGQKKSDKQPEKEVVTFIGLMEWCDQSECLKPKRGKRLALRASTNAPYVLLQEKAVEKW